MIPPLLAGQTAGLLAVVFPYTNLATGNTTQLFRATIESRTRIRRNSLLAYVRVCRLEVSASGPHTFVMRTRDVALILMLASALAPAQPPGAAAIPSAGSQANSAAATLAVTVSAPMIAGGLPILGPGSVSTTYAWSLGFVTCGPGGFPACTIGGGPLPYTASVAGAPNQPLAIAMASTPAVPMTLPFGSYLMANVATAFGQLHLPGVPTILLDGIGLGLGPAAAANTGATGTLVLPAGQIPLGQGANGGSPDFAFQALVGDPTSAAGFTLSATMTTAHHQ